MTKTIEYEPYLSDYDVVFHGIFTLIDPAMNTSEIKPLHLAVPRNRQGMRVTSQTTPSGSSLAAKASPNQPTDDQKPSNQRFLAQRYLNQNRSASPKGASSNAPSGVTPQKLIQQNAEKMLPPENPKTPQQQAPPAQPAQEQKSRPHFSPISSEDNQVATELLIKNAEYWILPLSPSLLIRFKFYVDGNSGPGYVFKMALEFNDEIVLTGKMIGASRASGINIFFEDKLVGEARYTPGNSTFFVGVDSINDTKTEACAVVFNPSFASASQPRIFDFLVPALKKISGKSRMFPIPFSDSSSLVTRLSQMSKEAIRLKTRIPIGKGNSFDLTFDGKFSDSSLSNFILYHDSNIKKDICSLGMISDGVYNLEIGYPLSPLQGFLAAVASTMPV